MWLLALGLQLFACGSGLDECHAEDSSGLSQSRDRAVVELQLGGRSEAPAFCVVLCGVASTTLATLSSGGQVGDTGDDES